MALHFIVNHPTLTFCIPNRSKPSQTFASPDGRDARPSKNLPY